MCRGKPTSESAKTGLVESVGQSRLASAKTGLVKSVGESRLEPLSVSAKAD